MQIRRALLLTALALLPAFACAQSLPASLQADLSKGSAQAVNCTPSGAQADSWLEMTNILNFTQYKNKEGADLSSVPDPLPFPFMMSASDTRAPGWSGTCISKSPSAPSNCTGDACNIYIEEWGVEWVYFADLNCMGSYPTPNLTNFFTSPEPPAGNISLVVTDQCKNYFYGPSAGSYFYQMTDQWGNKWALQTSQMNDTTMAEWDANVNSVVWPPGWSAKKVPLTANETHVPWVVGDKCYWLIIRDSNNNAWHQYTYPTNGYLADSGLLANMQECTPLTAKYTMEGMAPGAPAPAPASATGASSVGSMSSAASSVAPSAALLACGLAALLALLI